ncbi:MAG: phosphomannomutase/phosphoglucomutase [Firmicutes bacterium]|nr:phosphomannomutase/phosphoglucomutase [Alicyclobacillaceae bacterium]MCL6497674.1 phosphomannomutase/phosphoglucomutase [Bacillota bacterium]
MNLNIFREYDIRGVVGKDFDSEDVRRLGQAFATYLGEKNVREAIVGWDSRSSSPALRDALIDGLTHSGVDVLDIGEVTTPIFYYAYHHYRFQGGVMVTASHNPAEYNGFKLAHGPSTLYGEEIQAVARLWQAGRFARGSGVVRHEDPVPSYLAMLREKIQLEAFRPRVVVDCGNGTPSRFVRQVMEAFGVSADYLYCTVDPTFPHHHPDPVVAENLRDLVAAVTRSRADLGLAFDGDGDRIGVVDDTGRILWGDRLMVLYWREILPRYPGAWGIVEVKCSQTLYDEIARLGGRPLFYKTGHSLIKAKMRELNAPFTGEMSGHMFFADEYFGFDDAFYAAGRLLRLMSRQGRPLSSLLADVPDLPATPEVRIDCPDDRKFEVVAQLTRRFRDQLGLPVIDVDGVRVQFPAGWGLVRASNTQPALVARAEAQTAPELDAIVAILDRELRRFPEVGAIRWS